MNTNGRRHRQNDDGRTRDGPAGEPFSHLHTRSRRGSTLVVGSRSWGPDLCSLILLPRGGDHRALGLMPDVRLRGQQLTSTTTPRRWWRRRVQCSKSSWGGPEDIRARIASPEQHSALCLQPRAQSPEPSALRRATHPMAKVQGLVRSIKVRRPPPRSSAPAAGVGSSTSSCSSAATTPSARVAPHSPSSSPSPPQPPTHGDDSRCLCLRGSFINFRRGRTSTPRGAQLPSFPRPSFKFPEHTSHIAHRTLHREFRVRDLQAFKRSTSRRQTAPATFPAHSPAPRSPAASSQFRRGPVSSSLAPAQCCLLPLPMPSFLAPCRRISRTKSFCRQ
ncbi:hypothetical protein C8Q76DRAFT_229547 [Earliella scabrosa]|nr:hypothetical protein C8Q76DRAFT_229547 [Earliella scabrosa]